MNSIGPRKRAGARQFPWPSPHRTSGGQRIQEHNLPREAFEWYIDLRKYGTVPHGGFGMGIERSVAWICGLEHIRETIAFPRMLYRLESGHTAGERKGLDRESLRRPGPADLSPCVSGRQ